MACKGENFSNRAINCCQHAHAVATIDFLDEHEDDINVIIDVKIFSNNYYVVNLTSSPREQINFRTSLVTRSLDVFSVIIFHT